MKHYYYSKRIGVKENVLFVRKLLENYVLVDDVVKLQKSQLEECEKQTEVINEFYSNLSEFSQKVFKLRYLSENNLTWKQILKEIHGPSYQRLIGHSNLRLLELYDKLKESGCIEHDQTNSQ